jgi:hypothetical protein
MSKLTNFVVISFAVLNKDDDVMASRGIILKSKVAIYIQ